MGTRSRIGILKEDGSVESVFCHWDGDPSSNGKLLLKCYNTKEAAQAIIELGDISFLGRTLEYGDTRDYKRWRNEERPKRIDKTLSSYLSQFGNWSEDYLYLFKNDKWYVFDDYEYKEFTPLEDLEECKEFKIYNKLVRDNIPEIIKKEGKKCKYHIANSEEHIKLLKDKLQEEVNELLKAKTREEVLEEVADVIEVIEEIAHQKNWTSNDVCIKRLNKYFKKGGFNKFIVLESVEEE